MTHEEPHTGAFVFRTDSRFVFCSARREPNGFWSEAPPCFALPDDAPDAELGAAVKKVINASSTSGYADDAEAQNQTAQALAAEVAQVKSWYHLVLQSRSCAIRSGQSLLTLIPRESQADGAPALLMDKKVTVDEAARFGPIGQALRRILS